MRELKTPEIRGISLKEFDYQLLTLSRLSSSLEFASREVDYALKRAYAEPLKALLRDALRALINGIRKLCTRPYRIEYPARNR